jgi:acetylglutamate kinase
VKILVKLGGTLLDDCATRDRIAADIVAGLKRGHELVVVHGGGKQMTRFLSERGVESRFVGGLRVSTPEVIDAVLKVIAGTVNHELVASLNARGANAVGLSGIDAFLTEAEPLHSDLGAVGRPVRSNNRLLDLLSGNGFLPVVACVAGDRDGRIYNVNADQMAVACAKGFRAARLIFLTDVEGVRSADGSTLPELTIDECERLITDSIATGGMQAKLNACIDAINGGVRAVVIGPGAVDHPLSRLLEDAPVGTRICAPRVHVDA